MKLSKVFTLLCVVALFALTSCNKNTCYECVDPDGVWDTINECEDDYPGGSLLFNAYIDTLEDGGDYVCTKQ